MPPKKSDKMHIGALSVMTSCGCNLNCEYCQIHQNKNAFSAELQKNTIQALKDGSFLKNVKDSLVKLEVPLTDIVRLSLWGQEPTLTLEHITDHLEDWCSTFPKLNNIFFSTNTMAFGDKIINFIKKLNDLVDENQLFSLSIQFSYDGSGFQENLRKGSSSQVYDNLKHIIEETNKIKFKENFKVAYAIHNVISRASMRELDTIDKIEKFWLSIQDWMEPLNNMLTNKNIHMNASISPGLENPVMDASVEDGILFADFLRKNLRLKTSSELNQVSPAIEGLSALVGSFIKFTNDATRNDNITIDEVLRNAIHDPQKYYDYAWVFNNGLFCGAFIGELKFMYDGTMLACQNDIYDTNIEGIPADKTIRNEARRSMTKNNFYFNILNDPDGMEKFEKIRYLFKTMREESFCYIHHQLSILLFWLAEVNQVDISYYRNFDKIVKHAFYLAGICCCFYNNIIATGSTMTRDTGFVRFFCNGVLDVVEDFFTGPYLADNYGRRKEFKERNGKYTF